MLLWEAKNFIYVEHFCIAPGQRDMGAGRRALKLPARADKTVILEIDPPDDDISRCRKNLYVRAGFMQNGFRHIHPHTRTA